MFPFPIARPQGCDIQTFYGPTVTSAPQNARTWNKPVGVSHVYMMLIGGGGDGNNATEGGGSGAVTVWYGAAQHVPNSLLVYPAGSRTASSVLYRGTSTTTLLSANAGSGLTGGSTSASNQFSAMGFYQSIAGQDGASGNQTASATTFLSGGSVNTSNSVTANYGYGLSLSTTDNNGTFLMQPIIVGIGGKGSFSGGIGCGGGLTGKGGPGLVLIASW